MLQCSCFKGGYRLNFWRGAVRPSQATWWRRKRKMAWRSAQRHVKKVFQNMAASEITSKILVCYCILVKNVKKVNDEQMAHNPNENWGGKSEGLPAAHCIFECQVIFLHSTPGRWHFGKLVKNILKNIIYIYIYYIISCVFITTKNAGLVYDIFPFWWSHPLWAVGSVGLCDPPFGIRCKKWSIYSSKYRKQWKHMINIQFNI